MQSATLRFRHGGLFKTPKNGLVYLGGECKTFEVDPDELCWWWIEKLAKKCGGYKKICEVHYLLPGLSLEEGLRRVYDDNEVREMTTVLVKKGFVDDPDLLPSALEYHTIVEVSVDVEGCSQRRAKKFTPKRAPNKEAKGGRKRAKEVMLIEKPPDFPKNEGDKTSCTAKDVAMSADVAPPPRNLSSIYHLSQKNLPSPAIITNLTTQPFHRISFYQKPKITPHQ